MPRSCSYRLLLIEDDPSEVALLRAMLHDGDAAAFSIDWVPGVVAALAVLGDPGARYDAMLVDVRLDDGHGLDLIAELRQRGIAIPAVLVTAYHDPELEERALREGAADYLTKSELVPLSLRRAIRNAVERHRMSRELQRSEWRYRMLAAGFPNGAVLLFDADDRLALADGEAIERLGLAGGAGIGLPIAEILPEMAPEVMRLLAVSPRARSACEGRHAGRCWLGSATRLPGPALQAGFMLALLDVTDLKALQFAALANDRLGLLGHIAGGVAHEFNNLHAIIIGTVDRMMRRQEPPPELRRPLELIRTTADRAAEVTHHLLNFARGGRGEDVAVCDVPETVQQTLIIIRGELESEGVAIDLRLDPVPTVLAPRGLLGQVVMNLALNARDAMRGIPAPRLAIACWQEGTSVALRVADNGHGVPAEVATRIFDPFFTTKDGSNGRPRGTGLGLSLSRTIIERLGGEILVETPPGGGTAFRVSLPMRPAGLEATARAAAAAVAPGTRVLVIEDDQHLRDLICDELLEAGWTVAAAPDPAAASLELARSTPHVVLADLQMALLEPASLADRLAALAPRPRLAAITGCPVESGLRPRLDAVFPKPFDLDALRSTLAGLARMRGSERTRT